MQQFDFGLIWEQYLSEVSNLAYKFPPNQSLERIAKGLLTKNLLQLMQTQGEQ